ncbi:MAG: DNA-binding transcriptional regulator [Acidobacteria bacterium]|nr:DNA-binding transcriptional regulator [Acidobacteriota bacterium]
MSKTKTYRSEASEAIHTIAQDLHDAGLLDKKTMRRFDKSCLVPVPEFTPDEIREIREREEVSQSVFGRHLNVSKESVSQWERGQKKPAGTAMKLLSLVQRNGLNALR